MAASTKKVSASVIEILKVAIVSALTVSNRTLLDDRKVHSITAAKIVDAGLATFSSIMAEKKTVRHLEANDKGKRFVACLTNRKDKIPADYLLQLLTPSEQTALVKLHNLDVAMNTTAIEVLKSHRDGVKQNVTNMEVSIVTPPSAPPIIKGNPTAGVKGKPNKEAIDKRDVTPTPAITDAPAVKNRVTPPVATAKPTPASTKAIEVAPASVVTGPIEWPVNPTSLDMAASSPMCNWESNCGRYRLSWVNCAVDKVYYWAVCVKVNGCWIGVEGGSRPKHYSNMDQAKEIATAHAARFSSAPTPATAATASNVSVAPSKPNGNGCSAVSSLMPGKGKGSKSASGYSYSGLAKMKKADLIDLASKHSIEMDTDAKKDVMVKTIASKLGVKKRGE